MDQRKDPVGPPDDLRQQAEAQVQENEAQDPADLSPEAAWQVLHELRVHEVELQLQNEELRRPQAQLEASRSRYFDLYDLAPVGYFTLSGKGLILEANLWAAELLGMPRNALLNLPLSRFVLAEDEESYFRHRRQLVETGVPQRCELRLKRVDAAPFWGCLEASMAQDPEGVPVCRAVLSDVTARKDLEQELIQAHRLRAMGELSAGVCHNLNNLLTSIMLPAEALLVKSDDPKMTAQLAEMIIAAGNRATDLVHRLHLSVRRASPETLEPIALDRIVEAAVELMRPRWKDEPEVQGVAIEVHVELGETPPVKGVYAGLHDILVNLLLNAVDAMPKGGIITISSQRQGDLVRLDVTDTGVGMDEQTRRRVFEPFFTTKMTVGAGLGLSTLRNTIAQWGGAVAVDSAPGKGTTLTLWLPVWEAAVSPAPTLPSTTTSRPGRVLIIDDDQAVGKTLMHVLSATHQVEVFTDGLQALEQFGSGKYDVAIIDLGMPGISGDQVAQRIEELDPVVARILFSGWLLEAEDPRRRAFDFVLQKPLRGLHTLEEVVAQAIVLRDQRVAGTR